MQKYGELFVRFSHHDKFEFGASFSVDNSVQLALQKEELFTEHVVDLGL